MKVKCITNKYENLLTETIEQVGYPENYIFDVKIGNIYTVYSIITLGKRFLFLLGEDSEDPFWYPGELFLIESPLLPINFYFGFRKTKNYSFIGIWGYKEMVINKNHYDSLIESIPKALKIFEKRKNEIDEYEELLKTK